MAVPAQLVKAVAKAAKKIDGRYCYGLPSYSDDTKLKVKLVKKLGDRSLLDENDAKVSAEWIPFAKIGDDPQFLVISQKAPYRVGVWEHEEGKVHKVWPSLAEFVSKLVDKRDKSPFQVFDKALDRAEQLLERDKFKDVLALLEPFMKAPPKPAESLDEEYYTARAFNFYGRALSGVDRKREARAAFDVAAGVGDELAILNILRLYEEAGDSRSLIAHALKARKLEQYDAHWQIWAARYLAVAYATLGKIAEAEAELRKVVGDFGDDEQLAAARGSLERYLRDDHPNKDAVQRLVALLPA